MSNPQTISVTLPNVSASMDDVTFDVFSGASLALSGSSDTVLFENGAQGVTVSGSNNRIMGAGVDGLSVYVSGSNNTVDVGENCHVEDVGNGDTDTIGANSTFAGVGSSNSTVYATQGGDNILAGTGAKIYANNDVVQVWDIATVSGSGNQIISYPYDWDVKTLNLDGSNNVISVANGVEMTINTSSGSLTEGGSSIVASGNIVPGGATLTAGVLTIQLGNGNVATMSGVASGTQIEYIDASGNANWSTLLDTNLARVGGNMYDVTANVSALMSNSIFDVLSGASLNVIGSSDTVILESGAQGVTLSGNGNRVMGSGISGLSADISGSGNTISVGANANVHDVGVGDTVTIGANSSFGGVGSSNSTVYATQGGDNILAGTGGMIYANNDVVQLWDVATVNGSGNQISGYDTSWQSKTLNLDGSNNAIAVSNNGFDMTINTSSGSLTEGGASIIATGSIAPGSATLTAGVLTMQLGNGNVATMSGVASGTQIEYIDASGGASWSTLLDTDLIRVGGNMYDVTANVSALMSNSIFDVLSGASLNVMGSSDTLILESGARDIIVSGGDNRVMGSGVSGLNVNVSGSNNTVDVGENCHVEDVGSGDTDTIGANSTFAGVGSSNSTVYATQGGDNILAGTGAKIYANNDVVQVWDIATVSGSGNQIISYPYDWDVKTLNLDGSNNVISVANGVEMTINTSSGSLTEGGSSIVASGNIVPGGATLTAGVLTIQLGNGNVATMSGVASGTQIEYIDASGNASLTTINDTGLASSQTLQLVAALASYSGAPSCDFSTVPPTVADSHLLASAQH